MPKPTATRPYTIPGFRIALVREPGVKLAEKPQVRFPAEGEPMLRQYIGEADREMFVVALLTIRHRVSGLHTVSVGVALTRRLGSAGSALGIEIIDHLILSEPSRYVSLNEREFL